jgi:nucleoside-diphosphate-sugar epimerase
LPISIQSVSQANRRSDASGIKARTTKKENPMKVFVTGATGFVGSAVVQELISAGHEVLGLARSDVGAKSVAALGAQVHLGDLGDTESLRSGAMGADAVIHTAFNHDFLNYGAAVQTDTRAIETLGEALAGSGGRLIVTSGTLVLQRKEPVIVESDSPDPAFPRKSEDAARAVAARGVNVSIVRLPPSVHGDGDHGFVPTLIAIAREKGASAYIGEGLNRWPAVHRLDAARLYRLALEKAPAGISNYHGVGDEGIPTREIAQVIGRKLNLPVVSKSREEAADHFSWLAHFFAMDGLASSKWTQQQLGWEPQHVGLIADLEHGRYFEQVGELVS